MTPIPQITAAEAAHYSLSIRTTSGGLAFCITSEGTEGAATPRCIHSGRLEASASAHSVYEVLQELYFTYEFLSYPYRSIKFFYEMLPYVSPKIVSVDKDDRGIAVACRACDEGEVRAQIEIKQKLFSSSSYSLTIEPNTVFAKKGYEHLDDDMEADMYEWIWLYR